jgi:hypothetical protein
MILSHFGDLRGKALLRPAHQAVKGLVKNHAIKACHAVKQEFGGAVANWRARTAMAMRMRILIQ